MSDGDVFQGDQFASEDKTFIASNLDLFNISTKYKKYWMLPDRSPLHQAIEILIRSGISYNTSSKIMDRFHNSIGKNDISVKNFTMSDKKLKEWGISGEKISGIRKILALPEITSKTLCKIKEGGIHLVKTFKVISQEDDDVFLSTDYNVRRVLGILFFRNKAMTCQEALAVSKNWTGFRSQISYFLHRLRDSGAVKISDDQKLEPWDFHGTEPPVEIVTKDDEAPDLVSLKSVPEDIESLVKTHFNDTLST